MNILVTGATGFIGSSLCLKLASQGNIVHAYGRNVKVCSALKHENIKLFKGDILDFNSIKKAAEGCSEAFHLAAYVKVKAKDPAHFYKINVFGTRNFMEACVNSKIRRVVFTSSCGTFPTSGLGVNNEACNRCAPFFNEYAASKFNGEMLALSYKNKELEVVVVSPTRVYGPGPLNESNPVSRLIHFYIKGKWRILPGTGKAIGNYAFIDDVVEGHILAMEHGISGENYLLGGENISLNEFIDTLIKETKLNRWMLKIHPIIILVLIRIQEDVFKLFGKSPFITASWFKRLGESSAFSSEKAERNLYYKITPLTEGVRETIRWLQRVK